MGRLGRQGDVSRGDGDDPRGERDERGSGGDQRGQRDRERGGALRTTPRVVSEGETLAPPLCARRAGEGRRAVPSPQSGARSEDRRPSTRPRRASDRAHRRTWQERARRRARGPPRRTRPWGRTRAEPRARRGSRRWPDRTARSRAHLALRALRQVTRRWHDPRNQSEHEIPRSLLRGRLPLRDRPRVHVFAAAIGQRGVRAGVLRLLHAVLWRRRRRGARSHHLPDDGRFLATLRRRPSPDFGVPHRDEAVRRQPRLLHDARIGGGAMRSVALVRADDERLRAAGGNVLERRRLRVPRGGRGVVSPTRFRAQFAHGHVRAVAPRPGGGRCAPRTWRPEPRATRRRTPSPTCSATRGRRAVAQRRARACRSSQTVARARRTTSAMAPVWQASARRRLRRSCATRRCRRSNPRRGRFGRSLAASGRGDASEVDGGARKRATCPCSRARVDTRRRRVTSVVPWRTSDRRKIHSAHLRAFGCPRNGGRTTCAT